MPLGSKEGDGSDAGKRLPESAPAEMSPSPPVEGSACWTRAVSNCRRGKDGARAEPSSPAAAGSRCSWSLASGVRAGGGGAGDGLSTSDATSAARPQYSCCTPSEARAMGEAGRTGSRTSETGTCVEMSKTSISKVGEPNRVLPALQAQQPLQATKSTTRNSGKCGRQAPGTPNQ